ncbi:MAG: hypothetical protein NZ583_02645 [Desulfobacterota bacterium]|nr:hypothetical protein [Thermodesulfobacteriota bacterium]
MPKAFLLDLFIVTRHSLLYEHTVKKRKSGKEKRSIRVIMRLNKEEHEVFEKKASSLGTNISSFPIRHGRIDLGKEEHK